MKKENDKNIEDFLEMFDLKPAPPGLKRKILQTAQSRKPSSPVNSPSLLKGFITTLILLSIVIAVDAAVSSYQNDRLYSFLDLPRESSASQEEEWSLLKGIIWDPLDTSGNTTKKRFYAGREISEMDKRQHGWREILEEEFDYHENTKNLP